MLPATGGRTGWSRLFWEAFTHSKNAMVLVDGQVRFDREGIGDLILRSSFVVHRSESGLKIVFYLMHQNPVAVLKERGLLEVST